MRDLTWLLLMLCASGGVVAQSDIPSPMPDAIVDAYNSASCCTHIDKLSPVLLERSGSLELDLSTSEQLLDLSTGPSFAVLVELPVSDREEDYRLTTTLMEDDGRLYGFFPFVATLDANLNLLGSSQFARITYLPSEFIFQPTAQLTLNFSIEPNKDENKTARYLLIHTRARHFTALKPDQLKSRAGSVRKDEVGVELNKSPGGTTFVATETIYGLPGAPIRLRHNPGFF